ncbi:hypothetical protein Tco_0402016 [Tanacetum coccineum]
MSFGVARHLRALVHAGDKTSGDARSWYMVSGDAKTRNDGFSGSKVMLDRGGKGMTWVGDVNWDMLCKNLCSMRCPVVPFRMSTPMLVDLEISTQADGAQSSRVPVPYPEDPYEAIRQAYLVETDTKRRTRRLWTSSDSNSDDEDLGYEGPATGDEGLVAGDKGLAAGDEGPGMRVKSLGLGGDEAVHGSGSVPEPEGPKRVSAFRQPTLTTWIDLEDGKTYIDIPVYPSSGSPPLMTPPSPDWSSASLLISPAPSAVPSPTSSPMITLTVPSPVASAATTEA